MYATVLYSAESAMEDPIISPGYAPDLSTEARHLDLEAQRARASVPDIDRRISRFKQTADEQTGVLGSAICHVSKRRSIERTDAECKQIAKASTMLALAIWLESEPYLGLTQEDVEKGVVP